MSDLPAIITASVGAIGLFGAGVKWIWSEIKAWKNGIELQLEECRARETRSLHRRSTYLAVIELFWGEMERLDPENRTLKRNRKLLDDLKKMEEEDDIG